jgi:hypothetical protein
LSTLKKYQYKYWTFTKEEISDLQPKFEQNLKIIFSRDYENVWEWIWNQNRNDEIDFNISREHNWESGEYSKPLRIIISSNKEIDEDQLNRFCSIIIDIIRSDLQRGDFSLSDRELNKYKLIEILKYKT